MIVRERFHGRPGYSDISSPSIVAGRRLEGWAAVEAAQPGVGLRNIQVNEEDGRAVAGQGAFSSTSAHSACALLGRAVWQVIRGKRSAAPVSVI